MNFNLGKSWADVLSKEFKSDYFIKLTDFLDAEYASGKTIYPAPENIFAALNLCPLENTRVIIIGQDPYHGPHQANGLCFSVPDGTRAPPSLRNIFKEIELENICLPKKSGDLSAWAGQGVLLLNSVLTVQDGLPASHAGKGWEQFTDTVIKSLSDRKNIVYILWGIYAHKKAAGINASDNLILKSVHPSPLSAHRGFFGNNHFTLTNEYLIKNGKKPIDW